MPYLTLDEDPKLTFSKTASFMRKSKQGFFGDPKLQKMKMYEQVMTIARTKVSLE